jgi:hypothetical protein
MGMETMIFIGGAKGSSGRIYLNKGNDNLRLQINRI